MNFAPKTSKLVRICKIRGEKLKDHKKLAALKDVDLELQTSELFGLLGPNDAGKPTLIKILTILRAPFFCKTSVAGFDVLAESEQAHPRINMVSGGESSGYGLLIVQEKLWMFSHLHGLLSKEVNRRIKHFMDIVGIGNRFNNKSAAKNKHPCLIPWGSGWCCVISFQRGDFSNRCAAANFATHRLFDSHCLLVGAAASAIREICC